MLPMIDAHVHLIGNGSSGSGCTLSLGLRHALFARVMLRVLGLPQSALTGPLDELYLARIEQCLSQSPLGALVLLAHELPYSDDGTPLPHRAAMYVPNDYVLQCAERDLRLLPAVSIHPSREDAIDELERCIERGAVMMKCLPNCQNIDCASPRARRFWERMAQAKIPLLAHTGGELSLPVLRAEYENPRCLTPALECGVTVIAAHAATNSMPFGTHYLRELALLLERYPSLYCDTSALCSPVRCRHIPRLLQEPFLSRLIHGSDLPIPVSVLPLALQGRLPTKALVPALRERNPLARDIEMKRAMGFPEITFTRIWSLLPRTPQVQRLLAGC